MSKPGPQIKPKTVEPVRFKGVSKAAREMLAASGETERFEFKRDASAVKPKVLVAAANWVALDPAAREKVTLLVGVDEEKDPDTGLVTGKIVGLSDLDKSIDAIQQYCASTLPVPVGLRTIEENVGTSKPFLRLEIWPEHPPHYDSEGRRVVRLNASTRSLTDQEMLDIYLDREAVQFDRRFRETAAHLESTLNMVASGVDDVVERVSEVGQDIEAAIGDQIQRLEDSAWRAADEAEESKSVAEGLQMDVGMVLDRLPVSAFWSLRQKRAFVWMQFAMDAVSRPTKATPIVERELRHWLELPIDVNDWLMNQTEWEFWADALARRGERGNMSFWTDCVAARQELMPQSVERLGKGIAELRADRDAIATRPSPQARKK